MIKINKKTGILRFFVPLTIFLGIALSMIFFNQPVLATTTQPPTSCNSLNNDSSNNFVDLKDCGANMTCLLGQCTATGGQPQGGASAQIACYNSSSGMNVGVDCTTGNPNYCTLNGKQVSCPAQTGGGTAGSTGYIATGSPCQGDATLCQTGYCGSSGYCAAPPPAYLSACNASASDPCQTETTGMACLPGGSSGYECLVASPNITTPNPTTPSLPQSTIPTLPAANSTNTFCPDGLSFVNGICLPTSNPFPTTGIAGSTTLSGLLLLIIQLLLTFAGIIAVVMLVLGGYWYMAAGGNEEMAEKGKNTIINFVLGLIVILLAYTIVTIISNTLTTTQFTK